MARENEGRVVVDDPRAAKVGGNLDGEVVPKAMGKEEVEGRALGADGRVVAVKRSPRAHAFVSLRVEITDQQLLDRGQSLADREVIQGNEDVRSLGLGVREEAGHLVVDREVVLVAAIAS